jgi:hypothetical protein
MTSKQHTSTFQKPFSMNQAQHHESSKNILEQQTLNHRNFQNSQPFSMIQVSK